jgi:uncharacterized protein (DUF1330 family)
MTVFMIASIKVTNDAWLPDYAAKVHDIVHKHGGKYLSRSAKVTTLEGTAPDVSVVGILQFPSIDAVRAFADDPAYAPYAAARRAGSDAQFFVVDDSDAAGTIPYLSKA